MHGILEVAVDASFSEIAVEVRTHFLHSTRLSEFWGIGPDVTGLEP